MAKTLDWNKHDREIRHKEILYLYSKITYLPWFVAIFLVYSESIKFLQ